MARGRRPADQNVVPLTDDGYAANNLEARARDRLAEIRPEGLSGELLWTFDRLALPLCHPTVNRLSPVNVHMFTMLCRAVVRHERLTIVLEEDGETYTTKGRQGLQVKSRPEVAQLNETFRQIRGLAGEFGMTPATERGLSSSGQLPFDFPPDGGPDGYMT